MTAEDDTDPAFVRARSRVGTVLREKWHLDALLGLGGMAAVYAATHRNGSRVAVKVLHAELSTNTAVRQRFLREGYVANTVAHEGAVRVSDDDVAEDGAAFLVMELLDGETIEERRLRFGGRLDEDEVLTIAQQVLDVLVAAHAKGIIHRDLKPENIFLTRTGQVKVLDFGIARLREVATASTATRTGTSMGTPAYMGPEQARGLWDEVDGRTDLWAVGATMYTLLSGHLVHEGRTTNEVLLAAMTKPPPPLASVAPGIATTVAHVVDTALAFDKAARWPDAATMQEAVRRTYHHRHGAPITAAPRLTVPETVSNRTLAGSGTLYVPLGARQPTTGQPVANSQSAPRPSAAKAPARVGMGLVIGGTIAAVALVTGIVIAALAFRHTGAAASASAASASVAPPSPVPAVALVPVDAATASGATASSAIDVGNLPPISMPAPTAVGAAAKTNTTTPASVAATASTAKRNCNPPYVVDPVTKKKNFKVECL